MRQALPAFHAGQRELLFCNTPILVEGPSDSSVLLNVATKLELPIGAAGLGVAPMGGKYQLLAYRALLGSLAKTSSRFVLDRDTAVSPQVLSCLDNDERVVAYLAKQGLGGQSLSAISGALIGDLKSLVKSSHSGGTPFALLGVDADGTLRKGQEAAALGVSLDFYAKLSTSDPLYSSLSHIEGRFRLIRAAARQANVLILSKGSIEAYYASPPSQSASDFDKQQALQAELDAIWNCKDLTLLRARYEEQLEYIEAAGFLSVPLSDMAREPVSDLVHLLQTDIRLARISNLEEAKRNARAVAEGYWDLCELIELNVKSATDYEGVIELRGLAGEKIKFSQETHAYNIAIGASKGATEKKQAAQLSS
ncbi:MAG: hypothetical protein IPM70_01130 [Proteobacteria bacterium]|nr:hypothetical protein [Pseudomonadota bacterium]